MSLFIIQQGGGRFNWDHTPVGKACWISACVGAGCTAVSVAAQALLIRRRVAADVKQQQQQQQDAEAADAEAAAPVAEADPSAQLEGACRGSEGLPPLRLHTQPGGPARDAACPSCSAPQAPTTT